MHQRNKISSMYIHPFIWEVIYILFSVESVLSIKCLTQRKSILVVEKLKDNNCSLSIYSIKGERKTLKLGLQLTEAQLVLSDNDINTIHCALFFNEGVKLLQVDLTKMKIIAQAFLA